MKSRLDAVPATVDRQPSRGTLAATARDVAPECGERRCIHLLKNIISLEGSGDFCARSSTRIMMSSESMDPEATFEAELLTALADAEVEATAIV